MADDLLVICLVVAVLVIIWLLVSLYSVRVYRFFRPTCPFCIESQAEWDNFKSDCMFKLIKCIEVNLDTSTDHKLIDNFGVSSVPTVVAVTPCGRRYKYDGDRTAAGYSKWVAEL